MKLGPGRLRASEMGSCLEANKEEDLSCPAAGGSHRAGALPGKEEEATPVWYRRRCPPFSLS